MRKGIAFAGALCAILLITGCTPKFDGPIQGTQKGAKRVKIKFEICARESGGNACADEAERRRGGETRHLIAVRVPKGTGGPASFASRGQAKLDYERHRQYGRQLNKKAPTPGKSKWLGYISEPIEGDEERARYGLVFKLPKDPGKKFRYRPITGVVANPPGEKKVNCGPDIFADEEGGNAACSTDPTKRKQVRRSLKISLD